MTGGEIVRPFRWDVSRRSQLGSLPQVEPPETYAEFEEDLFTCAARALAFADDSDLLFVGRSPHAIFDLLAGLLFDTSWSDRMQLLEVSLRYQWPTPGELATLRPYLEAVGLAPRALERRRRPLTLVDVVADGGTFQTLVAVLSDWADEEGISWQAVARPLRIVGLTWREQTSPNTLRWQQQVDWRRGRRPAAIKNVSIPGRLFAYLTSDVPKTSRAFAPDRWTDPAAAEPWHSPEARLALALAVRLFDLGCERRSRIRFAGLLALQPTMSERWLRSLVLEIKR